MQRPLDQQRIINVASGYCFACWGATTLAWLMLLVLPGLAGLFGIMAGFAAVLGLPRSIQTLRGKFIVVPLGAVAYLVLCGVIAATAPGAGTNTGPMNGWLLIMLSGLTYSAVTAPVIWSIARHDFAKPVPAWLCRTCGYTLVGLRESNCPECGEPFDPERVPEIAPNAEADGHHGLDSDR